ncbi:MAG: MinD/ParA family protein [Clostridiales bacterium]|jgi:flagellar biosynthesis protein FlhG|nr:MinD/ParA family protein [Clostridiales bacterium]
MIDQAENLRSIMRAKQGSGEPPVTPEPLISVYEPAAESEPAPKPALTSRLITVTSGKGGVGKTNFTINLALSLAKTGKRVIVMDADFGLANIEVLLGIIPKYSLADVLSGRREVAEAITEGPLGVKFLSGGSGLREMANITGGQIAGVIDRFAYLDSISDVILIDTGAGITDSVINFIKASGESIIITTPEPTSITDAYAVIKASREESDTLPSMKLVVNRVDDPSEGEEVFAKLSKVSKRFLNIDLISLGSIPYDSNLVRAVKRQQPVIISYPDTAASKAITHITNRLFDVSLSGEPRGIMGFMTRFVRVFK